jgi:hypothetical protein
MIRRNKWDKPVEFLWRIFEARNKNRGQKEEKQVEQESRLERCFGARSAEFMP